jgi:Tol biopolymer transport system component
VLALDARVTTPGQTMGTVAYMSPEQVRGEDLDARTDIFSFGVVIYEMVTGRLPFQGATTGVIFDGILNKPAAPAKSVNAAVPAELDVILAKALEKDRELRYQSARELRADLSRLRRDTGSGRSVAVPVPIQPRRRVPLIAGIAALAVVGAAAAAYVAWPRATSGSPPVGPATLTRVTFEAGLQAEPAWSPDGRFIAYSSDQSGNFDIWVQPLAGGGRAVQVTNDPASDWSPAWSPDGNSIAFRSEREGGGIFVAPALGGRERKIASFGYWPTWSPDGSTILFEVRPLIAAASRVTPHVYTVPLAGGAPTRILEKELDGFGNVLQMTWHPDGKRVSFIATATPGMSGFVTVPIAGGTPVRGEPTAEVAARLKQAALGIVSFTWGPKGDVLYVEGSTTGIQNLWRIGVDPDTLQWISGPDRLTTGPGIDSDIAVSRDGKRLAFVTRTETSRLWSLPFDAAARRVTGDPQPVTPPNLIAMGFDLSSDGKHLVFVTRQSGKQMSELWSRSMDDGKDSMLGEGNAHFAPRLSLAASAVAYRISVPGGQPPRRLEWMPLTGGEAHALPPGFTNPFDWSPDGKRIVHTCPPPAATASLCVSSPTATNAADTVTLVSDPEYSFWQGRYSPDGRWIAFNAQNLKDAGVSVIGIVAASGGKWSPLTARKLWADKPRWAPDGRAIYFVSNREGAFFDVWGLRIDPATGTPAGEEFRVTRFDSPGRTLSVGGFTELGVGATRLVVPLTENSGGVWTLDNVGP